MDIIATATPSPAPSPGATPPDPTPTPAPEPAPAPTAVTRPEGIPDEYWDDEAGVKHTDMLAKMNELTAFKSEVDSRSASLPENADGYEVKLPDDFKLPEGFELPEGEEFNINSDDPRVAMAREFAFANNMDQKGFESLLALGAQADIQEQADFNAKIKTEAESLGGRHKDRINAVTSWLNAKLGDQLGSALSSKLYTADQVKAYEALMSIARSDPPGSPGAGRDTKPIEMSDEEYEKLSPAAKINYSRQLSAAKNSKR